MASKPPQKRTKNEYHASEFERLGRDIMNRKEGGSAEVFERRYIAFFGVSVIVTVETWKLLLADENDPDMKKIRPFHLLWGLMFLKLYSLETELASLAGGVDEKTFRYWSHLLVNKISFTLPEVIIWDNRKKNDEGNDCLVSVDASDAKTTKQGKAPKAFWGYKFRSAGLRYELGASILGGDICWLQGPLPPGDWNDISVFRGALKKVLEEEGKGERVEADDGYRGEDPEFIKTPSGMMHDQQEEALALRKRIRSRQETVNKRIKQFKCISETFRHDILFHGYCFRAVVVLTQLSINNGMPLFPIEDYSDSGNSSV